VREVGARLAVDAVRHRPFPGARVVITFFGDLGQFSAKKMAFFSKTDVMIKFLYNLALHILSQKRKKNLPIFGAKIFKNHNTGPWGQCRDHYFWRI
jgi:hypothetical protein